MSMDAYNNYMALIQQGVPQYQAYQQSGLGQMSAQWDEQRRQQAIEQEKLIASQAGRAGRQQLGGQLTGALATKAGYNYLMGKPLLGETGKAIAGKLGIESSLLGTGSTTTAAPTAITAPAAPEILSASRVPTTPTPTTPAPAPGMTLGKALGGAGVALGTYQAVKGIEKKDPMSAGLGGVGIGAGLTQLGFALGPAGWALAIGAPIAGALINKMGDKDRWKEEYERKKKLVDEGIIPESMLGEKPTRGRTKEELLALEEEKIARGEYGNPAFAQSRDVKDLRAEDIWGFAVAPETLGKSYMQASEEQRRAYNQQLLNEGLVREARGQISYTDKNRAKEIWNEITGIEPEGVK